MNKRILQNHLKTVQCMKRERKPICHKEKNDPVLSRLYLEKIQSIQNLHRNFNQDPASGSTRMTLGNGGGEAISVSQANCGSVRRTAKPRRRVAASLQINQRSKTRKKNQISRSFCMLRFIRQVCNMKPPVNSALLHDVEIPTKKATFGMGCFWSNDSLFGATPGVIRTRVGYSGGTMKNPAYRNLGDHTEVIELDFDPKAVTYEDLLDMFWANHEYGLTTKLKRQYQSMILYHDEEQRGIAEASYKSMQIRCNDNLRTEIASAGTFYPAEDYHQKYRLQGHKDLCRSLGLDSSKLQTSHLAARLNGYLVGVGGINQFEQEVAKLGLSEKQAEYVRREIERNEGGGLAC